MANSTTVEARELVFEIGRYAQSWVAENGALGSFATDRLEYNEQMRVELYGKLHTLTTQILERKLVEDSYPVYFSYKVPSSWWQHLKLEKGPSWFINRYPVRFDTKRQKRTVTITRKATYPMADVVVPRQMGSVVIRDLVSPLSFSAPGSKSAGGE